MPKENFAHFDTRCFVIASLFSTDCSVENKPVLPKTFSFLFKIEELGRT